MKGLVGDIARIDELASEIKTHAGMVRQHRRRADEDAGVASQIVPLIGLELVDSLDKIGEALELVAWQLQQIRGDR